jgi:hypothetical protein
MTNLLEPLRKITVMRKLLRRPPLDNHIGKFHGYSRSRGELRRLYKKAGLSLVEETSAGAYHYIAILAYGSLAIASPRASQAVAGALPRQDCLPGS